MKKLLVLVVLSIFGGACTLQPHEALGVGVGQNRLANSGSSSHLDPAEVRQYVENFTSDYVPMVGAYFPIDNTYAMFVKEDTVFETRNYGPSVQEPRLQFRAYNPSATGNEIKEIRMTTDPSIDPTFEITSATAADFHLSIETANGTVIEKEIELEIIEDKLYLDKVAVGVKKLTVDQLFLQKIVGKHPKRRRPLYSWEPEGKQSYWNLRGAFRQNGDLMDVVISSQVRFRFASSENVGHYYSTEYGTSHPVTLTYIGQDAFDDHVLIYSSAIGSETWALFD
ncbi:MAG: hypothetical protein ACRC9L_08605 [Brevinema sp.]